MTCEAIQSMEQSDDPLNDTLWSESSREGRSGITTTTAVVGPRVLESSVYVCYLTNGLLE